MAIRSGVNRLAPTPKSIQPWLAPIAIALPMLTFSTCGGADQAAQAKQASPRFAVTAVVVKPREVPIFQESIGSTFALNTVQVNSRVNGYIEKWLFRPGEYVEEGRLLYLIDQRTYRAVLERAAADVARAESQLVFAREGVEVLRAESELAQASPDLRV